MSWIRNRLPSIYSVSELIYTGNLEGLQVKLNYGADVDEEEFDKTPICFAIELEHVKMVNLLIAYGANVNQKCSGTGKSPLSIAVEVGNLEIIKLLVENGAIDTFDESGDNAKETALRTGNLSIVKTLYYHL